MAQNNQQHFIAPPAPMHPVHYQQQPPHQTQQPLQYPPQPFVNGAQRTRAQQHVVDYAVPRQVPSGGYQLHPYVQHLHQQQQQRQSPYSYLPQQQMQAAALGQQQQQAQKRPGMYPTRLAGANGIAPGSGNTSAGPTPGGKHPSCYGFQPRPIACSAQDIDLNSSSATTPNFSFVRPEFYRSAIHILSCPKPRETCMRIKNWLVGQFGNNAFGLPGILCIEGQALHLLKPEKEGTFVLLEDAAHLDGDQRKPVTIIALLIKGDSNVRWFYNLLPPTPMLRVLVDEACILTEGTVLHPGAAKHKRMFTYLRGTFLKAVTIPEHPDYLAAQQITDYCPDILDPDTAYDRLEADKTLYFANNGKSEPLDLAEDRYTHELHPAESSIASDLKIRCSAYILLKRRFFFAFWKEVVAFKGEVGQGRLRVRTEHAHEVWLVESSAITGVRMKSSKAKRLVIAWRILGFLNEKRCLPWLRAGGMLEEVAKQMEEEGEGSDAEANRGRGDGRVRRRK